MLLAKVVELEFARGNVVEDGVTRDRRQGIRAPDVLRLPPDHHGQLAFVIELGDAFGSDHDAARPGHRGR